MLLAIDTATRIMSLALHDGQTLLAEQTWHTADYHTAELAPAVEQMLKMCAVPASSLTAVAVSTGPGSYTGLRIGVALAKGMASARGVPLVGVPTLDIIAAGQPYFSSSHTLAVVLQAGRSRLIVKTYRWRKGRWTAHSEAALVENWEALIAQSEGPTCVTGEVDTAGKAALESPGARDLPVEVISAAFRLRRAGFLAEEALHQLKEGKKPFKPAHVLPLYIKTKDTP